MIYFNELDDLAKTLAHVDGMVKGFGESEVEIDVEALENVLRHMRFKFPAQGGQEAASAFKMASNFFCFFIDEKPIKKPFPIEIVGEHISQISNHQNVMVAFAIVKYCLFEAEVKRFDCEMTLKNEIQLSKHSYIDMLQACCRITPKTHFHIISVFFEQLVYRFNPDVSYDLEC